MKKFGSYKFICITDVKCQYFKIKNMNVEATKLNVKRNVYTLINVYTQMLKYEAV